MEGLIFQWISVMIHILDEMFSWPNGIVVGNLIAAMIGWFIGIVTMHIKDKPHRQRIKEIHEKLTK